MKCMAKPHGVEYRTFRDDAFWRQIPAWRGIREEEFADHQWQSRHSITKVRQVRDLLGDRVTAAFMDDLFAGQKRARMNIRITPYIFSLIDWRDPESDPLRKQFLPLGSQFLPDHPFHLTDSLSEDADSPVPMLVHRYPDRVLFLPLTICPVYCSYCTRSRVTGGSTDAVGKASYGANSGKWDAVFAYLRENTEIEDVVISGGDAYNLRADQIEAIGQTLLAIPHIRRIRYATKGIAVLPMKILSDEAWVGALQRVVELGRSMGKQVAVHTHFSSPREITIWSKRAMDLLFADGIVVRNQAVLQVDVNDSFEQMERLTRKLEHINVQPYYVYQHDMVPGCEHFRTTLAEAVTLSKEIRGTTAGFNTPTFVCDLPGGGGKRPVESYEYYDRENGISIWTAPIVKPFTVFAYFDPIHKLGPDAQRRWADPAARKAMVRQAKTMVGL